jgi:hypothetical protein
MKLRIKKGLSYPRSRIISSIAKRAEFISALYSLIKFIVNELS